MESKNLMLVLCLISLICFTSADHNNGTAPYQENEFDHLYVPMDGELTLDLDRYFDDAEEKNLEYEVKTNIDGFEVTFDKSYMTIRLLENFSGYEKFTLLVTDGDSDTGNHSFTTDFLYLFEEESQTIEEVNESLNESGSEPVVNESETTQENNSVEEVEETVEEQNEDNSPSEESSSDEGLSFLTIAIILSSIAIIILIVLAIIANIMGRKSAEVVEY